MAYLKDIILTSVAELDDALKNPDVFVETDSYNKMLDDKGVIVAGRKGSGKTAIKIGLKEFGDMHHDIWLELNMKDFDFENFRKLLLKTLPDYPDGLELLFKNLWRVTIVSALMAKARNHNLVNARDGKLKGMIDNYFHKHSLQEENDFFRFMPDEVLSKIRKNLSMPKSLGHRKKFSIDKDFLDIEGRLMGALNTGLGAVITIDDLDDCVIKYYHEIVVPSIEGLLKASEYLVAEYGINDKMSLASTQQKKLRIKCFIPKDVYTSSNYRHMDKLATNASVIQWNSKKLCEMLARHIAPYLSGRLKDKPAKNAHEILDSVFNKTTVTYFGSGDPFAFILFHTLYRPRDILYLVDKIFKRVCQGRPDAKQLSGSELLSCLEDATKEYSKNIIREYGTRNSDLENDVKLLHNGQAIFPHEELKRKWCTARIIDKMSEEDEKAWQDSLQGLFDAGVVGYEKFSITPSGTWANQKIVFSFVQVETKVPPKCRLAVHPLFWSTYNIMPAKFQVKQP